MYLFWPKELFRLHKFCSFASVLGKQEAMLLAAFARDGVCWWCLWRVRTDQPHRGSFCPHSEHPSDLPLSALHKPASSCGSRQRETIFKLTGVGAKVPVWTARAVLAAHISLPAVSFPPFDKPHTFYNMLQPIWEINFLAVLLGNGLQNTHKTPSAYTMQRFYGTGLWRESLFWVFSAVPCSRTRGKPSYAGAAETPSCNPSDNAVIPAPMSDKCDGQ